MSGADHILRQQTIISKIEKDDERQDYECPDGAHDDAHGGPRTQTHDAKKAAGAGAHKLLDLGYAVWKRGTPYTPERPSRGD